MPELPKATNGIMINGEPTPLFNFAFGIAEGDWRKAAAIHSLLTILVHQMIEFDDGQKPIGFTADAISMAAHVTHAEIKEILNKPSV